ncbi:MAG TPA: TetR family transcriptional regulator [Fontimonas sp.]
MARRTLSRGSILTKAAALMKQRGVQAVTIRGLAEQLDVTPMAIYKHFRSKDDLLSALLDRFIVNADVLPKASLSWDRWLHHVGKAMWTALTREPDWMALVAAARIRIGGAEVLAGCLEVMESAGFSTEDAMEAFFSMSHVAIGAACLESRANRMDLSRPFDTSNPELAQSILGKLKSPDLLREMQRVERGIEMLVVALRTRLNA